MSGVIIGILLFFIIIIMIGTGIIIYFFTSTSKEIEDTSIYKDTEADAKIRAEINKALNEDVYNN